MSLRRFNRIVLSVIIAWHVLVAVWPESQIVDLGSVSFRRPETRSEQIIDRRAESPYPPSLGTARVGPDISGH